MRKAIGYIFFATMLIVSWGIRLGLPIFGIYYIIKTFIDDGVIAGLISIPVTMIIIGIIEFVLGFAMFPFAMLVYFLLDQERPSKPSKDWFQRHLNWTVVLLWVLVLPLAIPLGDILGISVDAISLLVPIVIILPLTGWALKQKNRSLWWLLLFIIPFVWLVYLGLENRSSRDQGVRTLQEQRAEAIATESQEKEYEHNVWEIYRKEWETASNEKRAELNKRMRHWQELMKSGLTASQAYIRVMEEETDTPQKLMSDNDKNPREERIVQIYRKEMSRALWGLLFVGVLIIVIWSLLTRFLPMGWWITLINILGFIGTTLVIGMGTWQTLKMVIPSGYAFLVGVIIWLVMVLGLRTLILGLLGG